MSRFADLVDYFLPPPKLKLVAKNFPWWIYLVFERLFADIEYPRAACTVEDWIALIHFVGARRFRIYEGLPGMLVIRVPLEFVQKLTFASARYTPLGVYADIEPLKPIRCVLGLHRWIRWYGGIRAQLPESGLVEIDVERCSGCPQLRAHARKVDERPRP